MMKGWRYEIWAVIAFMMVTGVYGQVLQQPSAAQDSGVQVSPREGFLEVMSRVAGKESVGAGDYEEIANRVITFGEGDVSAPREVIERGLMAVDAGESMDPQAADWAVLREKLKQLLDRQKQSQENPEEQEPQEEEKEEDQKNEEGGGESKGDSSGGESGEDESDQGGSGSEDQKNEGSDSSESKSNEGGSEDGSEEKGDGEDKNEGDEPSDSGDSENSEEGEASEGKEGDAEQGKSKSEQGNEDEDQGAGDDESNEEKNGKAKAPMQPRTMSKEEFQALMNRLEQVRNQDVPALLFQRMQGGGQQEREKQDKGKKNW